MAPTCSVARQSPDTTTPRRASVRTLRAAQPSTREVHAVEPAAVLPFPRPRPRSLESRWHRLPQWRRRLAAPLLRETTGAEDQEKTADQTGPVLALAQPIKRPEQRRLDGRPSGRLRSEEA